MLMIMIMLVIMHCWTVDGGRLWAVCLGRYAGWSKIIGDVVELMKNNTEDMHMQTASIKSRNVFRVGVGFFRGFVRRSGTTRAEGPHVGVPLHTCGEPNEIESTIRVLTGLLYRYLAGLDPVPRLRQHPQARTRAGT